MGAQTSIEWAANADGSPGATWNPIRARDTISGKVGTFCVHASPGCENCYAEKFQGRNLPNNGIGLAYTAQNLQRVEFFIDRAILEAPSRRRKPTTWFLSSMTDVFGEWMTDAMIDEFFAEMANNPRHTFIVVTKRSKRMREYLTALPKRVHEWYCNAGLDFIDLPLRNVWLVVSCEDQRRFDERAPDLMATPAIVRGLSCEPLLGPIDLSWALQPTAIVAAKPIRHRGFPAHIAGTETRTARVPTLDWVICGGESGQRARPMHPAWARSLRDQCAAVGVPYFFKQFGEWAPRTEYGADTRVSLRRLQTMPIGKGERHITRDGRDVRDLPEVEHFADAGGPTAAGCVQMVRLGKHLSGRELDGRTHDERPTRQKAFA